MAGFACVYIYIYIYISKKMFHKFIYRFLSDGCEG